MKIAILLLNQGRGSGEVARYHAKHLLERGNEVYFMHPRIGDGAPGAKNMNIELHTSTMPVHEYLPAAKSDQKQVGRMSLEEVNAYLPAYESALESVIDDVDIILGHHANLSAIAVHNVAKKHNKPYTLFLHGTGIEPRHEGLYDDGVWALIKEAIEKADGILATTEYVRDELIKPMVNVPDEKFLILPCGVDLTDFHPTNVEGIAAKYELPEKYVICPGALMTAKGPQNVVAASEVYSDLAETIFIGAGELREELEKKLGDRGRFLGYVSSEDKAQLINNATLLVAAPEKKEHFGIIYAEALAGGTPPVAYEGGGVASIVTEAVGVLTERSPEKLGQAVRQMLQDPEKCAEMGKAGRARAEVNYSYPILIENLDKWLSNICDRHNS